MFPQLFTIITRLTLLLFGINLLSYFEDYVYVLEILTHFKAQYFFLFLLSSLFFILFCQQKNAKQWLLLSLFGLSLNAFAITPIYISPPNVQTNTNFSVLLANVLSSNSSKAKFVQLIQKQQADFLVVLELSPQWAKALEAVHSDYPYRKVLPRSDNFGIALYSKHLLKNIQTHDFSKNNTPSITANSRLKGKEVLLIATHPYPPINQFFTKQQKNHFSAISQFIKQSQKPVVLAGDLNTSMWSSSYKNFMTTSSLKNTRQGYGIIASWQANNILQIPLDHILINKKIDTLKIEAMPSIDSDHLPIYVELSI